MTLGFSVNLFFVFAVHILVRFCFKMPLLLNYKVMHGKTASMSMVHLLETDLITTRLATRFITRRQKKEVLTSMQSYVDRKATAKRKQIPFVKDSSGLQICRLYTQCIIFKGT